MANTGSNTLTEYSATANGDNAPLSVISDLDGPRGITLNTAGDLVVTNTYGQMITTFNPASPSNLPTSTITGAATDLSFPIGIDEDAAGRLYVANQFAGLNVYAAGVNGNAAPTAVISGAATGLAAPGALAVTPPLYIVTHSLPRALARHHYHAALHSILGRRPLHWKLARGHLPPGLKLTRAGLITGTTTHTGTWRFTVC